MYARGFKTWCENASAGLRDDLRLQPIDPLDPRALADYLGVIVWRVDEIPGLDPDSLHVLINDDPFSWSAATVQAENKLAIIINSVHSPGRTASNLTHEIAHLVLGHVPAQIGLTEDGLLLLNTFNRDQESEANWFSGCLLLPREALLHSRRQERSAQEIADQYGTSFEMVEYRLRMTGVDRQVVRGRKLRRR